MTILDILESLNIDVKNIDIVKLENILFDIGNYLKRDPVTMFENYPKELHGKIKQTQNSIYETGDELIVEGYYKNAQHFLFELAIAESNILFEKRLSILMNFVKKRFGIKYIADFGGGLGGFTLFMRKNGYRSDYIDLESIYSKLAQYRFINNNVDSMGLTLHSLNGINEKYDLITSFEVFEHLFDVQGTLDLISRALKPNAYFICQASFFGEGDHLKKNHKYNDLRVFEAAFSSSGLRVETMITMKYGMHISLPTQLIKFIKQASGRKIVCRKIC